MRQSVAAANAVRILLVSDLHYTLPQFDWVVRLAPSYDLVVLAGDHLDVSSPVALDTQSVVLLRYFSLMNPGRSLAVPPEESPDALPQPEEPSDQRGRPLAPSGHHGPHILDRAVRAATKERHRPGVHTGPFNRIDQHAPRRGMAGAS